RRSRELAPRAVHPAPAVAQRGRAAAHGIAESEKRRRMARSRGRTQVPGGTMNARMWSFIPSVCLAALLACASVALAHEGHLHKVMGTVVAAGAPRPRVNGTEVETRTVELDD